MKRKIRICVLHGAISNAGDFLIYKRGKKLLENFFDDNFDFIYKLRSKPITGDFDGLILLGGPLVTRTLHVQSKNIVEYIKNRNIPIFCMGLGISGKELQDYKNYFLDRESVLFWKYIYETTNLFSVRDIDTSNMLKNYGINAEMTGCPALFNLQNIGNKSRDFKNREIRKIAVTIPNIRIRAYPPKTISDFLKTTYLFYLLSKNFKDKEVVIFFQHGYAGLNQANKIMATIFGFESSDISGESLEKSGLDNFDIHIGTRLHSHIYFLSLNKPSFLLSVGARTDSFLKTIRTPNERFTASGIKNMVYMVKNKILENNFDDFDNVPGEIKKYFLIMKNFLGQIESFYRRN